MGGTGSHRKGFHLLKPALDLLAHRSKELAGGFPLELAIFGADKPRTDDGLALPVHYLGHLDSYSLALAYSAADVFAMPSMQDNLPLTIIEAMACGTPVVTFDIPGVFDLVRHGCNGYLARSFDPMAFAEGIAWVLTEDGRRRELSDRSFQTVQNGFTIRDQARRYADLYRELTEKR
jgi:glycosyltransferase involved in cell wall biosynthesis